MRKVSVYNDLYGIDEEKFKGIKEIIKVTRTTYKSRYSSKKPSVDVSYYISSKNLSAKDYNIGIRKHWLIENSLHYVKDVTFKEDASLIRSGNAPANFSIIRNFAINAFRTANFSNIAQAVRLLGGNIKELVSLLE
jgi:predicted transposase YbfD/YdcC